MSIASEITRLQQAKADIKSAIENKGVTVPSDATLDAYDGYIDDIEQGGGGTSLEDKPVIYIDYDGSVVYGYTAEEFAQLTEHPANPDHSGDDIPLTSQGWNWSLSDAKTYVASKGYLVIGQMYITTDGATYIGIDTTKSANDKFTNGGFSISFYQYAADSVSVDFGDGTTPQTVSGTGAKSISHTYAADGQYVIKLTPVSNNLRLDQNLFGYYSSNDRTVLYQSVTFIRIGTLRASTALGKLGECNLTSITIPSGVTTFSDSCLIYVNCVSIILPDGLTQIGTSCFSYSNTLKYISVPKSLVNINNSAFLRCLKLQRITLPDVMTKVDSSAFTYCIRLERVVMPTTLTTQGTSLFSNCHNLKYVNIPTNQTSVPYFMGCESLESIVLPSGITTIGNQVFNMCYNLEVCDIPNTVTTISKNAFNDCRRLKRVSVPSKVTLINESTWYLCRSIEQLSLSDNITSIGNSAFNSACSRIKTLTLPSKLETIGVSAFIGCFLLKDITIPNKVTTIGDTAFSYCTSAETITIGEKVSSIGKNCFTAQYRDRDTLQAIYMLPQNPPSIASSSFSNLGDAFTIYVPQGRLSAYQSATNWTTLASKMVEMTT